MFELNSNVRLVYLYFALGLALFYISFSPASITGMGYTGEEIVTGDGILSKLTDHPVAVEMPRNGPLPVLLDLPFLGAGRVLFSDASKGEDLVLATQPCILTALIATLAVIWTYRLTGSPVYGVAIGCVGAVATMLWPYAYIGLETKQSFFLLLAAFLALEFPQPGAWPAMIAFSVAATFAVGAKSTGVFLVPALAYLTWCYLVRLRDKQTPSRILSLCQAILFFVVPSVVFVLNAQGREMFWAKRGTTTLAFIKAWAVTDAVWPFLNFMSFFGSPNKGLFVFCPVCLLGCYALVQAWRGQRRLAGFTLLTLGGLAGGFSLLRDWSDETWGPRYLHAAVAPLLIAFAVVWFRTPSVVARGVAGVAIVVGLAAAILGMLFPYGFLSVAVNQTGQDTLEGYQGDIGLNHLRFNEELLELWLLPQRDGTWSSARQWFYDRPADARPPKTMDLHPLAVPQSVLLGHWRERNLGPMRRAWHFYFGCLLTSCAFLTLAFWRTHQISKRI